MSLISGGVTSMRKKMAKPTGGVRNEVCRLTATRTVKQNSSGCSITPKPLMSKPIFEITGDRRGRMISVRSHRVIAHNKTHSQVEAIAEGKATIEYRLKRSRESQTNLCPRCASSSPGRRTDLPNRPDGVYPNSVQLHSGLVAIYAVGKSK